MCNGNSPLSGFLAFDTRPQDFILIELAPAAGDADSDLALSVSLPECTASAQCADVQNICGRGEGEQYVFSRGVTGTWLLRIEEHGVPGEGSFRAERRVCCDGVSGCETPCWSQTRAGCQRCL